MPSWVSCATEGEGCGEAFAPGFPPVDCAKPLAHIKRIATASALTRIILWTFLACNFDARVRREVVHVPSRCHYNTLFVRGVAAPGGRDAWPSGPRQSFACISYIELSQQGACLCWRRTSHCADGAEASIGVLCRSALEYCK